jgi:hypothetical protein
VLVASGAVAALVWAVTAPNARFAVVPFWVFALGAWMLALTTRVGAALVPKRRALGASVLVLVGMLLAVTFTVRAVSVGGGGGRSVLTAVILPPASKAGYFEAPSVAMVQRITDAGLAVGVPVSGLQVWNADLPATPVFDPKLRARQPGDLGAGFEIGP